MRGGGGALTYTLPYLSCDDTYPHAPKEKQRNATAKHNCHRPATLSDMDTTHKSGGTTTSHAHQKGPLWFRTPLAQTVTLGLVFFFVFSSYTTIQFYARTTYGPKLSADCVSCVYFTFTGACLVAPAATNKWGSRRVLFWGVLGYASLVSASLVYFIYGIKFIVILGGGILGVGAALLWTGQGRLILDYAAVAPSQSGTLMGVFWAVFQCSAIVGGLITFLFYSESPSGGSVGLYVIFLCFIVVGALSTQLLLSPADLIRPQEMPESETTFLQAADTPSAPSLASVDTQPVELAQPTTISTSSWYDEAKETLLLFWTRPMGLLSVLFFYTGFNQPYQQATFSNRFFSKRTIGLEMVIFHLFEIVGAMVIGRVLDKDRNGRRRSAMQCLLVFIVVNTTGNLSAWYQENQGRTEPVDIADFASMLPSLSLALWGFADSLIQVYVYWLLGTIFESSEDHSRAVGLYKCVQSLGVSIGFSLTPLTRLPALQQLALSSTVYAMGTALAFFQLPE